MKKKMLFHAVKLQVENEKISAAKNDAQIPRNAN